MSLEQSYTNTEQYVNTHGGPWRPVGLPEWIESIPSALRDQPVWGVRKGKVPHQARAPRYGADSTNPEHWGYLNTAQQAVANGLADGLGSVMAADLGMVFIDLDHCFDDAGQLKPHAAEIVAAMPTHWHVSMSGGGLHGICYGQIPKAVKDSKAGIEMYASGRYIAWPNDVRLFGEVSEITDCSAAVSDLYARLRPPAASTEHAQPAVVSMDTRAVIDRLQATQKAARLLSGDTSGYPGFSEARFALAGMACFWTDDATTIADVLLASNLFKPEHNERERERRSQHDATTALNTYTGERYNPNYGHHTPRPGHGAPVADMSDDPELMHLSPDELRAIIRKQTATIETERAARIAAEQRADRAEQARSGIHSILRNPNISTGARLTGFAIAMDMNARVANGETPTVHGYRAPAARYAEATGQSVQTVTKHMRELSDDPKKGKYGLITKTLVREQTELDEVDLETGEIVTVPGARDVNYIALPDSNVIQLIDRFTTYQRADDDGRHGGTRTLRPVCELHPNAGTYTVHHEHIECAACRTTLETSEPKYTYHAAEIAGKSSPINLIPDTSTVVNTRGYQVDRRYPAGDIPNSDTNLIADTDRSAAPRRQQPLPAGDDAPVHSTYQANAS